ncbi:glycosaminoglycan xylosylkinase-like [Penaeus japonicus]|uniref:glycosaminoglycan xylosylkinase-like n=1 Tax=Penaeus japonicus TaxID=27405 RepID=UPI001C70FEA4|nr:glycosaminoglycan xylosylkinase-like [Penaeus japonicus]
MRKRQSIVAFLVSGTLLLISIYLLETKSQSSLLPRSYHLNENIASTSLQKKKENVPFFQGEVFIPKEISYKVKIRKNRTGLQMLSSLYDQLPSVRATYSSVSPYLDDFIKKLKEDLVVRGVTTDPWDLARKWANPNAVVPENAPGLGDVLAALSTAPIIEAGICTKGLKLKVLLTLEGNQKALFKPIRCTRDKIIPSKGPDRHNAEIVAFHLGRLLGNRMVPMAAGRLVSVREELWSVAVPKLAETFYTNENEEACFYGVCHYCKKMNPVCATKGFLEGVVILWFPDHLPLNKTLHPWRFGKSGKLAKWETDTTYCTRVLRGDQSPQILDFVDQSVFDFLIQNDMRYHAVYIQGAPNSSLVPMDNGKSLGDPNIDRMDRLAPLLQCCRIRQATYERLILLSGGGISRALRELLALDPVAPVLTEAHLSAMDRRVTHILAALSACREKEGGWEGVLY